MILSLAMHRESKKNRSITEACIYDKHDTFAQPDRPQQSLKQQFHIWLHPNKNIIDKKSQP